MMMTQLNAHSSTMAQEQSSTMAQDHSTTMVQDHSSTKALEHSFTISQGHPSTMAQEHSPTMAQDHSSTMAQEHTFTMAQEHTFTMAQDHSSTKTQEHSSTKAQEHSSIMAQEHSSTMAQDHSTTMAQDHAHTALHLPLHPCMLDQPLEKGSHLCRAVTTSSSSSPPQLAAPLPGSGLHLQMLLSNMDSREGVYSKLGGLYAESLRRLALKCEEHFTRSQRNQLRFDESSWSLFKLTCNKPCCHAADGVYYSASCASDPFSSYAVKVRDVPLDSFTV